MLKDLGKELSTSRKAKKLSLEAIAGPAKISGAYLHKLEGGSVNNPSPRVLARIAVALDVSYMRLMELAGYLDEMQLAEARMREPLAKHPLADQDLRPEEWAAVGRFIKELVAKRES
jgi:HTH-type transcriptional regulator, competence development regulator